MAVTIQQIAERAGVSRGTVDRALNRREEKDRDYYTAFRSGFYG